MKEYNILVTGVGAIIGYGIISALRKSKFNINVIGIDIYDDAIGKRWCDDFIQGVPAASPQFKDFLLKVIEKKSIDLVMPGIEPDIHSIIKHDIPLNCKAKFVLNNIDLITLCSDKWRFHEQQRNAGIKSIKTLKTADFIEAANYLSVPFLQKPRSSSASKGIVQINDEDDFNYWRKKTTTQNIYQEIVGYERSEYTVGLFGYGDGTMLDQTITFQRTLNREGSTSKAHVVDLDTLNNEVRHFVSYFKPLGPTNMQFREHNSDFFLLEINPRFSSSLSLRAAFGFNEPEMCIEFFLLNKTPCKKNIKQGSASRYLADIIWK